MEQHLKKKKADQESRKTMKKVLERVNSSHPLEQEVVVDQEYQDQEIERLEEILRLLKESETDFDFSQLTEQEQQHF